MARRSKSTTDIAGNTFDKAYNLGNFTDSSVIINDFVGSSDRADIFRIRFVRRCYSAIALTNLQANADIEIFNSDRRRVGRLENTGRKREFSVSNGYTSPSGVFYIKVFPGGSGDTEYKLTVLTATP